MISSIFVELQQCINAEAPGFKLVLGGRDGEGIHSVGLRNMQTGEIYREEMTAGRKPSEEAVRLVPLLLERIQKSAA